MTTLSVAGLERLKYREAEGWSELPAWARFVLRVGAAAATADAGAGARLVAAVSVPTRAFAAALAATAAVVSRFGEDGGFDGASAHFEHLASLPAGTPVMLRTGNVTQQGRLLGLVTDYPDAAAPLIAVEMPKNGRTLLPEKGCSRIQVIETSGELQLRRRKLLREPEFVTRALPGLDVYALCARTRLDCVIVGARHALEYELIREHFGAGPSSENPKDGSLQGIARVRQFGGANDPYRSALVSASAESDEALPVGSPALVVFDGARGFNNLRSRWRHSNCLVVIDRSSPSVDDAAASINQAYASRAGDSAALATLDIPSGVELMTYLEGT